MDRADHRLSRPLLKGLAGRLTWALLASALVTGCGGGGGASGAMGSTPTGVSPPANDPPAESGFRPGVFDPSADFKDLCASPRPGTPDRPGSVLSENNWLRSWSNEVYLWYAEIEDVDPALHTTPAYFDLMKTVALTPGGRPKDRFHFTLPTDVFQSQSQSGTAPGYGLRLAILSATPPRRAVIATVEPASPAASANLGRGAEIISVDGIDFVNAADRVSVEAINAALFPASSGEAHTFEVRDPGAAGTRSVTLSAAPVTSDPVPISTILDTANGPVGYILFNDHIATAEQALVAAFAALEGNINDLILDIRYNGGGFLDIANEVAFMVAGPSVAAGRTFEELQFNDKHTTFNPFTGALLQPTLFHTRAQGFSVALGTPLPSLDLPRLFVLTGPGTCSASESIINSLRGIDIEVIQIGMTTCGKPFGFFPTDNCGTTYFSIHFKGVNAKGFGDYPDGFSPQNPGASSGVALPGCAVADDFDHPLGDPAEGQLAAAVAFRNDGSCPAAPLGRAPAERVQSIGLAPWRQNRIVMP